MNSTRCTECGVTWSGTNGRYHMQGHPCIGTTGRTPLVLIEYLRAEDDEHGCLIPTRNTKPFGYKGKYLALSKYAARTFGRLHAHQAMFELAYGPLAEGLEVGHVCGSDYYENGHCINPDHLVAMTHSENHRQMDPATRSRIGRAGAASPGSWATRFQSGHAPWNKGQSRA